MFFFDKLTYTHKIQLKIHSEEEGERFENVENII